MKRKMLPSLELLDASTPPIRFNNKMAFSGDVVFFFVTIFFFV